MAEEKKEPKAQKAAPEAAKPAPKPHLVKEARPHGKKVGKMTLAEINQAMELCKKQQGGLWSRYGQTLLGRKVALTVSTVPLKKAA